MKKALFSGNTMINHFKNMEIEINNFEELELAECCTDFNDFTADRIASFLGDKWSKRKELKAHVNELMPSLQQKALIAAECVARLENPTGESQSAASQQVSA